MIRLERSLIATYLVLAGIVNEEETMVDNKYGYLDVVSPASGGKLIENPSAFDDFWGTIIDLEVRMGEDDVDKRFYRQLVAKIRLDVALGATSEMEERYNLPTDDKTGEAKVDEHGVPVRPNITSKWGVQEVQFDTSLGVPWQGRGENLLGLHAHFVRKGTRLTRDDINAKKRSPRGEPPYGRYIVEWDHYDNDVRQQHGLEAITETFASVQKSSVPASVFTSGAVPTEALDRSRFVARLAEGKTFLDQYSHIRREHPEIAQHATRGAITELVAQGLLSEGEGPGGSVVYALGPNF